MNLGKAIHHYRKLAKVSQMKLGTELGVSQSYLSQLETNQKMNPTFSLLCKIAGMLEVPLYKIVQLAERSEVTKDVEEV